MHLADYTDDILVIAQAAVAFIFMIRYTMLIKWWKMISGRMLFGLVLCLFALTMALAVEGSSETTDHSPVAVTLARLGFVVVLVYGIINLEWRAITRRKPLLRIGSAQQDNLDAQQVTVSAQQTNVSAQQVNVSAQQANVDSQQAEIDSRTRLDELYEQEQEPET